MISIRKRWTLSLVLYSGLSLVLGCSGPHTDEAPSAKKESPKIYRYRIIVPRCLCSFDSGPMKEWPPQDVGEFWLDLNSGRFVYRYFLPNRFDWPEGVFYRMIFTIRDFKGIPAPPTGIEREKKAPVTLMAAAGYDGKYYWLSGPLGIRRYHSIDALNESKQFGTYAATGSHEWYDLALLHQMFRFLDNPAWDLAGMRHSLERSALVSATNEPPIDQNRKVPLAADGQYYIFEPSVGSGGMWKYHLLLDRESPSIKSCVVMDSSQGRTGEPPHKYIMIWRLLFVRESDEHMPTEDIFTIGSYIPAGALVDEIKGKSEYVK